jgi:hypothetical protein
MKNAKHPCSIITAGWTSLTIRATAEKQVFVWAFDRREHSCAARVGQIDQPGQLVDVIRIFVTSVN